MTFDNFGFDPTINEGLDAMGFIKPTPIQEQSIPVILDSNDLIACAQTGTGKTAAFLLPVIHKIISNSNRENGINTLIITPTRELALQIDQQVEGLAYFAPVSSAPVYGGGGGTDFDTQQKALKQGAEIIIATPGKLLSHLNLGYVNFDNLQHLILDEADRMLDMGFFDDIIKIVKYLPKERQTILFSATMPPKIRQMANDLLNNPLEINIALSKPAEGVLQAAYMLHEEQKIDLIHSLLEGKQERYPSVIIFTGTKKNVSVIQKKLAKKGFEVMGISSELEQKEREEVLNKFAAKRIHIVVGTDVISRGIDIKDISLVINFDVPQDAEDYVHRVGRTARAATTGVALTFITTKDQHRFLRIEKLIETVVPKVPIPVELGEAPEYNPTKKGGNRKYHKKGKSGNWRKKRNK